QHALAARTPGGQLLRPWLVRRYAAPPPLARLRPVRPPDAPPQRELAPLSAALSAGPLVALPVAMLQSAAAKPAAARHCQRSSYREKRQWSRRTRQSRGVGSM